MFVSLPPLLVYQSIQAAASPLGPQVLLTVQNQVLKTFLNAKRQEDITQNVLLF